MSFTPQLAHQFDQLTQSIFECKLVNMGATIIHGDYITMGNITNVQVAEAHKQAISEAMARINEL